LERGAALDALGLEWEPRKNCGGRVYQNVDRWEANRTKLEAYKAAHGDCRLPAGWASDPALGNWVSTQRYMKKKLGMGDPRPRITAARVAKLDELGFEWTRRRARGPGWEANRTKLEAYKASHGDCNVPAGWASDPALGNWAMQQRHRKKKLDRGDPRPGITAARVAKLDELGFEWGRRTGLSAPIGWEVRLTKLVAYKAAHGDCNVPQGWASDPALGRWVHAQRYRKKKLTAARVAKLDELGFEWTRRRGVRGARPWEVRLAKLEASKAEHGDCNVPQGWASDPPLGSWVYTQRMKKKKLDRGDPNSGMTAARVNKLNELDFEWTRRSGQSGGKGRWRNQREWEASRAKLEAYKAQHGDCNVPQGWASDPALGRWVSYQRDYKKRLDRGDDNPGITAARAAKLDALGFEWVRPRKFVLPAALRPHRVRLRARAAPRVMQFRP
jgi:hypothetical protein